MADSKKLFISYSTKDRAWAEKLFNDLRSAGADVFEFEQTAIPGQPAWKTVLQNIASSGYFLLLVSSSSNRSRPVAAEIDFAYHRYANGKDPQCLIPIILEQGCDLPLLLEAFASVDFTGDHYTSSLQKIMNQVGLQAPSTATHIEEQKSRAPSGTRASLPVHEIVKGPEPQRDNQPQKPGRVANNVVVSIDYTLVVDGEVVDSTEGDEPLQFLQGHQSIIPGLERELNGMKIGDSKTVVVPAAEAYGEVDPENVIEVPRNEFPKEIPLEPGTELEVKNADGEVLSATIDSVNNQTVKLDFNHPLAGKQLTFDVTVVDLRAATEEELAHGHVHGDDEDEFEDDEEYMEEELDEDDLLYVDGEEDEEDLTEDDEEDEDGGNNTYRR